MNTNNLKRFAQNARRKLMEQVAARLEFILTTDSPILREKGRQIEELKKDLQQTGKEQLIEKVAYTWFNRLVALRYMDANDYQPSGIRVITPAEGFVLPQALNEAKQGHIPEVWRVNRQHIFDLLDGRIPSANAQNEVFRELLMAACNHLNTVFPFLFERIDDYTELLLPDDLTSQFSVVHDVVEGMADEDCSQVEVIGWLYQFYISEEKDRLINAKKKYKPSEIAPVTQLFTPNWIVRYMVDNTLGQLWKEIKPNTRLSQSLEFYIKPADEDLIPERTSKSPEEITFFDPCCGSGHILVYAFDVFYKIYEELGYNPSEIPGLIITKNLVGIDIDDRAAQLAGFALMMKGRKQYSRFLRKPVIPNIMSLQNIENDRLFENAKELGSLIKVDQEYLDEIRVDENSLFGSLDKKKKRQAEVLSSKYDVVVTNPPYLNSSVMPDVLKGYVETNYADTKSDLFATFILRCLELSKENGLTGNMTTFVWMFISSYEKLRKELIDKYFINNLIQLEYSGFDGATVPICTFTLRNKSLPNTKGSYIRLSDFKGSQNQAPKTLEAISNPDCGWFYTANQTDFEKIPGSPVVFWFSEGFVNLFKNKTFEETYILRQGVATGNNDRFLRYWHEINGNKIKYDAINKEDVWQTNKKWVPVNKGGGFKKWYGNQELVIAYDKENRDSLKSLGNHLPSEEQYFKESISWSDITSSTNSFRYYPKGFIFNNKGNTILINNEIDRDCLLAYCNSKFFLTILKAINPTLTLSIGAVKILPLIMVSHKKVKSSVSFLIDISINDLKMKEASWDFIQNEVIEKYNKLTTNHSPLPPAGGTNHPPLPTIHQLYTSHWTSQFVQLHQNEEELNRIFIDIYGLQDELTPDVPLEEITILQQELDRTALAKLNKKLKRDPETRKVLNYDEIELPFDAKEVMAQLVSYAVGCMFGRYSLEAPGLILANQGEGVGDYFRIVREKVDSGKRVDSEKRVGSGEWIVDSEKTEIKIQGYESEEFQGFDRVAEGDGFGSAGVSGNEKVSEGGDVRADQPASAGSGVGAIEYRGRSGASVHGGVPSVSLNSQGLTRRSGNPADTGSTSELSVNRDSGNYSEPNSGNQQNDSLPHPETTHPLTTTHYPLSTIHYPLTTFPPDEDNIIPVLDEDWFEDDIAGRFRQFLKAAFGTEHFEENLAFVEQCLGKDIRSYFSRDFYPDHIRRYKKRPIYWMFSSPRGAFSVLIYMHRYTPDTVSNILNGYLRQYQEKLRLRKQHLQHVQITGTSAEKTQAIRESDRIDRILIELHEYERDILYPLAANRIPIDLDDGVLVNYNRFGKAIKEVAGLNDAATKKKVKAFDWVDTSNIF